MALENCKECGAEVSTEAESCPTCGKKHPTRTWYQTPVGGGVGCLVIIVLFYIIAQFLPEAY